MDLKHLGKQSEYPQHPDEAVLECVPYIHPSPVLDKQQMPVPVVRYIAPEFTSLCPVTGQPDFAHFTIDYVPMDKLVESKALKLYMGSFRQHRGFHEATTMRVARDFLMACQPTWLRVVALWYPRGGIPIDVFWQTGAPPEGVLVPDVDFKHYRGR